MYKLVLDLVDMGEPVDIYINLVQFIIKPLANSTVITTIEEMYQNSRHFVIIIKI